MWRNVGYIIVLKSFQHGKCKNCKVCNQITWFTQPDTISNDDGESLLLFFFFLVSWHLSMNLHHMEIFRVHVFQECKQNLSFHEGNHNWNLTQLGESIDKVAYLISPVFFPIHIRNYIYILWVCKSIILFKFNYKIVSDESEPSWLEP